MKKIIRLTESQVAKLVKRIIKESAPDLTISSFEAISPYKLTDKGSAIEYNLDVTKNTKRQIIDTLIKIQFIKKPQADGKYVVNLASIDDDYYKMSQTDKEYFNTENFMPFNFIYKFDESIVKEMPSLNSSDGSGGAMWSDGVQYKLTGEELNIFKEKLSEYLSEYTNDFLEKLRDFEKIK